ncbi:monocarboxylate permease [Mycena latifolia]|nr:monocarboxylate permease [Mycena latifolia]
MDPSVFLSDIQVLPGNPYEITTHGLHQVVSRDAESVKKVDDIGLEVLPSTSPIVLHSEASDFPDGGIKAWVVVFGVCILSSWGYLNSWGVFQTYYQQTTLHRSSPSQIAWIGSLQHSLIFLPGILVGRLFDFEFSRIPYAAGSALIILGTFLVPLGKVYWHFILCQGLEIGVECGLIFPGTSASVTYWWKRRRGLAFGIMASGGALGGTFFPIVSRTLLAEIGFTWTLRTIGFILMFTLGTPNLCIARRLPPTKAFTVTGLFGLYAFRHAIFTMYCIGSFLVTLAVSPVVLTESVVLTYIGSTAVSVGLSRNFAFYLVAIINGSTGVGRIACGSISDLPGPLNVIIPMTAMTFHFCCLWVRSYLRISRNPPIELCRFSLGAFSSLGFVAIAAMGGTEDLGGRIGTIHTVLGFGSLCGPPLAGLLHGYTAVGCFGGVFPRVAHNPDINTIYREHGAIWCLLLSHFPPFHSAQVVEQMLGQIQFSSSCTAVTSLTHM